MAKALKKGLSFLGDHAVCHHHDLSADVIIIIIVSSWATTRLSRHTAAAASPSATDRRPSLWAETKRTPFCFVHMALLVLSFPWLSRACLEKVIVSHVKTHTKAGCLQGGHVELSWSTDSTPSSPQFHLELDATAAPAGSVARIGLPLPTSSLQAGAADALQLRVEVESADGTEHHVAFWRSADSHTSATTAAAAAAGRQGVDLSAVRVLDGRLRLEMAATRKLSLHLSAA